LRYIDDLIYRERDEERLYSLADPNWNVVATTNAAGVVQERMRYDAFGKVTWLNANFSVKSNSDYNWNRTFTGQVLDNETELMLYRNRIYLTHFGRFGSRDPIGYRGRDKNLFRYVSNNTINFTDIFGLKKCQKLPSTNGCTNVPDSFFFFDFSAACNNHDICYGMCGAVQAVCDQDFLTDMFAMCQPYRDQLWNPIARAIYSACATAAATYYNGVNWFGPPYFDETQEMYCVDADENGCCPEGSAPAKVW
jgi:RHS repeat-associated protein